MKKYQYRQYAAMRLYFPFVAYSPDGKLIAHIDNTTGQFNLWITPSGGGSSRQLTAYTDNTVRAAAWSPDGTRLALQADQNGDEQHQIYVVSAQGGWPQALRAKLDSQHNLGDWSPNGEKLTYSANDQDAANMGSGDPRCQKWQ